MTPETNAQLASFIWSICNLLHGPVNFVPPDADALEGDLDRVDGWFNRVKGYGSK